MRSLRTRLFLLILLILFLVCFAGTFTVLDYATSHVDYFGRGPETVQTIYATVQSIYATNTAFQGYINGTATARAATPK